MRRLILRLAVAVLSFAIGIAATWLWFVSQHQSSNEIKVEESHPASAPTKQERAVVYGVDGDGISEDGNRTSFTYEEFSDGTSLDQRSVYYNSPKRATQELQKRLQDAEEIVKRETVFDEKGRQIGEKVIATFAPYKGSSAIWAELLWTEGARFISQKHSSLQSILEMEKGHQ